MLFGKKCEKFCRLANCCYSNEVCIFDEDGCTEEDFFESQYSFLQSHVKSCDTFVEGEYDD